MAVTYNIKGTSQSSFKVGKGGAGTVEIGGIDASGAVSSTASITGHLVPSANITYDLGTSNLMWRDVYVGPGSIYVNGKKVIEDNSGTITVSTDADQNLAIATSGTGQTTIQSVAGLNLTTTSTGDITFTTASGQVNFDGDVIVNATKSISSSNSDPITFADPISVSGNSTMANLTISGNLTVQGTTTTIDSTTVQIQNAFKFEGATADDFETTLTVTDPTADRTITLPDATGTVVLADATQTLTNKTLGATTISGHLTPSANVTYDLGTSSNRFRDIYLSGTTIDLGGAKLSNDGSNNLDIKDGAGNRKTLRASSIELVDSTGKIMKLERDASSGKLKQSRKNSDGSDEGSTDTLDIVGDTSPQLGGNLDTNGNNIAFGDNAIAYFGTSNDLSIYHSGTESIINHQNTGDLYIKSANSLYLQTSSSKAAIYGIVDGAVELYYDNSKKFETTSSGATVTGTLVSDGLTVDTNTFFVDATNNRVGIGTTSPAVGLDFQMINSGEGFRVRRHNASDQYIEITEGDGSRHEIKANGTKEFRITNTTAESSQGFHFYRNSAERLRILGDGLITFQDGAGTVAFTSDLYTNSDVDAHLNQSNPTSGYVLSWNGSDYAWVAQSSGGSTYTAQSSAPSSPSAGDEWYDTDTGDFYKYINDGTTSQWVEWSPAGGALGFTGGSYNASTGVVTFTSDDGLGFSTGDLRGADGAGASLDGTTAITGDILPDTTNTRDLGSSSYKYAEIHATTFYGTATSAQYADLAEMYAGDQAYEPGTVVVVGGTYEVTQCTKHLDSSLAGVVSEKPGYLMNKDIDAEYPVCVGFVGRVPVKVVGHIEKGDLLTTSSIPGFATKYTKGSYEPGCIIGVALNTKNEIGEGTVEVLLKRS